MAIGAQPGDIAWRVAADAFAMVVTGAAAGLGLGMVCGRFIQALIYHLRPTDPQMIAVPWLVILPAALLATIPAAVRAVRTDPLTTLRTE